MAFVFRQIVALHNARLLGLPFPVVEQIQMTLLICFVELELRLRTQRRQIVLSLWADA